MFRDYPKYPQVSLTLDSPDSPPGKTKVATLTREKIVLLATETDDDARDLYQFYLHRRGKGLENTQIRDLGNNVVEFSLTLPPDVTPNKVIETRAKLEHAINTIEGVQVINDGSADQVA